jgi:hypothetical protein
MTRVEATCPTCGTIECVVADLELGVCSFRPASYYAFQCPACSEWVHKQADARVIEILIAEGVQPYHFDLPAEALERPIEGPSFTEDDVLDLMLEVEAEDWFERLQNAAM